MTLSRTATTVCKASSASATAVTTWESSAWPVIPAIDRRSLSSPTLTAWRMAPLTRLAKSSLGAESRASIPGPSPLAALA